MPSIKSTPTLLTVSDAVSSSLTALVPGCGSIQASSMLQALMAMLQAGYAWVGRSSDAGGEQCVSQKGNFDSLHDCPSIVIMGSHKLI